jgi:hypothetical protein
MFQILLISHCLFFYIFYELCHLLYKKIPGQDETQRPVLAAICDRMLVQV